MKKDKKYYLALKENVLRYNKVIIATFTCYIIYVILYILCSFECNITPSFFEKACDANCIRENLVCNSLPKGLATFILENNLIICGIILIILMIFLILQKVDLLKINKLNVEDSSVDNYKVNKLKHAIITVLLGWFGIHKYNTNNKNIGIIYLTNSIMFIITMIIKLFFINTYNSHVLIPIVFNFSFIFLVMIIIMNITEAIFTLLSEEDEENKIFA